MRIKAIPEDFVVTELAEWTPRASGKVSVYEVRKRKLDTFDAVRLLADRAGVAIQQVAYVGLKDRQGVTTQLVSIDGGQFRGRIPGMHVRYLGRTDAPLGPDALRGNAFEIVVRDLSPADVERLPERAARLARRGFVDYFDDQRFGSLAQGQGLPGRDLVRGDFEGVVRALLAAPGRRDPEEDKRWKRLVTACWGDWELLLKKWGERKGIAIVRHLRRKPDDFAGALQRMPAKERAIHVFAYQSLVWNDAVARYLERKLPARWLARTRYVGGEHVWVEAPDDAALPPLVETFPLLDHTVVPADPDVRAAVDAALARDGLTLETFKIEGIPGCFFKHHERPLVVVPDGLRVSPPRPDDRARDPDAGRLMVRVAFSLPPGAYATLALNRLFGRAPDGFEEKRRAARAARRDDGPARASAPDRAPRASAPDDPARAGGGRAARGDEGHARGGPRGEGPKRPREGEGPPRPREGEGPPRAREGDDADRGRPRRGRAGDRPARDGAVHARADARPADEGAQGGHRKGDGAEGGHRKGDGAQGGHRKGDGAKGGHRKGDGAQGGHRKGDGAQGGHRKGGGAKSGHRKGDGAKSGHRKGGGAKSGHRKGGREDGPRPA